ncbi:AzlC family ABC transporter permease [Kineosporia sp. J2-2]|uniref:AzlC family ABC transporter permease n=1 Tax=Kineosporia corallincola TaxID=2835133 RepID=A0ABS5TIN5_9ACTN|nr:AzlC family ABC transporter permease [Kineosporia corallincola]MBT0770264.1 AzlC family ABC transporter permease [Kineosporia corallincola]
MPTHDTGPARGYLAGARIGAGLAAGSFVLALTFGAVASQESWGSLAPVVASLVIFSGSAQFALVTALASGGAAWAAVASAALINLRFLPMAIAVTPALHGGRLRRALEGQAVVDGSWVAAHEGGDRFNRATLIGATLAQWPAWVSGTALGVLISPPPDLTQTLGLDVVFPAFFAVLLIDELRSSEKAFAAGLVGGTLTAALLIVLPTGPALLGGSCAALIGLRTDRKLRGAGILPVKDTSAVQDSIGDTTREIR